MPGFAEEEARIKDAYGKRPEEDWRYSWLNPAQAYLRQEQHNGILSIIRSTGRRSLAGLRVLDVGCGSGHWLRVFVDWGAAPEHVAGIDLLHDRIAEARHRCAPGVRLHHGTAAAIPEPDSSFDFVLQSTAFTSIIDADLRRAVAAEMLRVLKPDGMIVWYDFHAASPNPDVRPIGLAEIRRLFPGCAFTARRVSLAPPIARSLAPRALWLCRLLNLLPFLRTHWLVAITKTPRNGF